jgi:glutamate 5-kinase
MEPAAEIPSPTSLPVPVETRRARPELAGARRVVVKLGTRVLVDDDGAPRRDRLMALVASVVALRAEGREVVVVTSGAVALGRGRLGLSHHPLDPEERRACAAVGQAALQALYQEAFAASGALTAQVLLTTQDFGPRRRPGLRGTMERLLGSGVVLVVNENDAVTVGLEVRRPAFRDNDGLAVLVAVGCRADALVLLTDVDGVFALDPRIHPGFPPLDRVDRPGALLARMPLPAAGSQPSRGGMRSKVAAAASAARSGCPTVIAAGHVEAVVERVLAGEPLGTLFPIRPRPSWGSVLSILQTEENRP